MSTQSFVSQLASLSFAETFNPYAEVCPVHDRKDAPRRRAAILRGTLVAAGRQGVDALWLGRDLGWRGGRRTGLAFTDDAHFAAHLARFGLSAARPTRGPPLAERTAAVVSDALAQIDARVFLWNLFPLHPHPPGEPFANRRHTVRERAAGEDVLRELIALLRPRRIVAIGADAAAGARRLGQRLEICRARHPSFGGASQFRAEIADLYPQRRVASQTM
jgi:uracil-DNA glycosylase